MNLALQQRMKVNFSKYQGTGNDFVMLDNMNGDYNDLSLDSIRFLCDRKLGIGADGLIKLSIHADYDFEVEYYNADGSQSFCGNGARCSVAFAKAIGVIESNAEFHAIDGRHEASIDEKGIVHLEMLPVEELNRNGMDYVIDTGSPHYIRFTDEEHQPDIVKFGKSVRYSDVYREEGINVNTLIPLGADTIRVATYERGVEDETLSCGTGVTACALAYMNEKPELEAVAVETKGGKLSVRAERKGDGYTHIWLSGPAKFVFNGSIEI